MLVCAVDPETISKTEADALARVVELLQHVAPETPVLTGQWTARDVAAHLVTVVGRYLKPDRKLPSTPSEIAAVNEEEMREFDGATIGELIGRMRSRAAKYNVFWPEVPLDQVIQVRAGIPLDVAALRTNWISELLIHGRDVAVAAGQPWVLDDTSSLLTLRLLAYMLPSYVHGYGPGDDALVVSPDGAMSFSIVLKDNTAEMQPSEVGGGTQISGPASVLVLLLFGRLSLAEAQQAGVRLSGDTAHTERVLDRFGKP